MGYSVDGTIRVSFNSQESKKAALLALQNAQYNDGVSSRRGIWEGDPNGVPQTFFEAFSRIWGTDMSDPSDHELTYAGWVDDKWLNIFERFADVVSPHASEITGDFRGEDGNDWAWRLSGGRLVEESLNPVADSQLAYYEKLDILGMALIEAVRQGADDSSLARVIKTRLIDVGLADGALLEVLAHDRDETVSAIARTKVLHAIQ